MKNKKRTIESVFAADADWQNNARIDMVPDSLELYTIGYKKAGDILAEYVMQLREEQDILIYPMVFVYRQYIELRLKEIIKEGRILLGEHSSFPEHHKILDLWNVAKNIALRVFENTNKSDLAYAEHVITEFAKIDPDGFSFRYPTAKKNRGGGKTLQGITHINIRRLAEHVNELEKDLEAISEYITIHRQLMG